MNELFRRMPNRVRNVMQHEEHDKGDVQRMPKGYEKDEKDNSKGEITKEWVFLVKLSFGSFESFGSNFPSLLLAFQLHFSVRLFI